MKLPASVLRRPVARAMLVALGLASLSGREPSDARPPARATADRALSHTPRATTPLPVPRGLRRRVLLPIARELGLGYAGEARNVTPLDEVADSSWFTHRAPTPAEIARGPCGADTGPQLPLTVLSGKEGGFTAGFVTRDARGVRYVLKFDQRPGEQPALTTAADAIVSRLYWAAGYNAPCNHALYVRARDVNVATDATTPDAHGRHIPLRAEDVQRALAQATHDRAGRVRVALSRMLSGTALGPFAGEGTRDDDPNDTVPHQHRRELRGERLLAAWVHRWDVRDANGLDVYEPLPDGSGGRVVHYMLDFGDALGAFAFDGPPATLGHRYSIDPFASARAWLGMGGGPEGGARPDPRAPVLGYFVAEGFDPGTWVPRVRLARFANATVADMAWMARRLARISPAHIRAAVAQGRLTDANVAARLSDVLIARRDRALRWAFARSSPLADFRITPEGELCATDLAAQSGIAPEDPVRYELVAPGATPVALTATSDHGLRAVCAPIASRASGIERGSDFVVGIARTSPALPRTVATVHVRRGGTHGRALEITQLER